MKRRLSALSAVIALLLLCGPSLHATLPASDACSAGAGTLADTPWIQLNTGLNVVKYDGSGNCTNGNNLNDVGVKWDPATDTFGADQFTQATTTMSATHGTGVNYIYMWLRLSGTFAVGAGIAGNGYWVWTDGGSDTEMLYQVAGAQTLLDTSNSLTFTATDVLKFQVVGNTLSLLKNGTPITWTTSGTTSVTDSHVTAAGQPGIGGTTGTGIVGEKLFSTWSANNIGGAPACAPTMTLLKVGRCG